MFHFSLCCVSLLPLLCFTSPSVVFHFFLCCVSLLPLLCFTSSSVVFHFFLCCVSLLPLLCFTSPSVVFHFFLCCVSSLLCFHSTFPLSCSLSLRIGKTWNACVFVIESPRGRSAKRPRRVAPRYLSRSTPQGLSITKTHKHSTSYVYNARGTTRAFSAYEISGFL